MSLLKCVFRICAQNYRKWSTDYRVWLIALLVIALVFMYADDARKLSAIIDTPNTIFIFPFLYSQFYLKTIYTIPIVLLFCNAPFSDSNQVFIYMRAGRQKWLCGQILYVITASALYYIFMFAVSVIAMSVNGNITLEWGKMLITDANDHGFSLQNKIYYLSTEKRVIQYFTPMLATWFTFLMSWLTAVFLGLMIFFCNITTGSKTLGIILSSALVAMTYAVEHNYGIDLHKLVYVSPVSWNTLNNIDVGGYSSNPPFTYCLLVDIGLITVLAALILIFGRKKSLDTLK